MLLPVLRLAVTLALLICPKILFACSCSLGDVEHKLTQANSVFVGKVDSIIFIGTKNWLGDEKTRVSFSVSTVWKGDGGEIVLDTADNKRSCSGYWFDENKTYLVYAYEKDGKLNTYYCGGVIPRSEDEKFKSETDELDRLGE